MRLDDYVVSQLNISKNKAQNLIKGKKVLINKKVITKSGYSIGKNDFVDILYSDEINYVARSALKLKGFLEDNYLDLENKICLDIGSSTGGFCQILLENNIGKVFAVDVGNNQLHDSLKGNEKIISIENTDIRKLEKIENIDFITCDVSFINLEKILDAIISQMSNETKALLLFKPQFQVGKDFINKKGVVKDEKISERKLNEFLSFCRKTGLKILKVEKSKLEGENGNKEIFILLEKKL